MKQLTVKSVSASLAALAPLFLAFSLLAGMAGGARAQTPANGTVFVYDTFTGTAGTTLDQHTGETGATWTQNTSQSGTLALISGGYVQQTTNTNATGIYIASGQPAGTDYDVFAPVVALQAPFSGSLYVIGHASGTSTLTGYLGGFDGNTTTPQVEIYRFGTSGALVSTPVTFTKVQGETYTPRLLFRASGSSLNVYLGVQRKSDSNWYTSAGAWQSGFTPCISYTDTSPLTGTQTGLWMGGTQVFEADSFTTQNAGSPLTAGTLSAVNAPGGVQLSASASLTGGSGAGYGYYIYRDTQPNVSTSGNAYATVTGSAFAYTDSAATPGTVYYYKAIAFDGGGNTVNLVPAGLGSVSTAAPLPVAGTALANQYLLVFIGDSITANSSFVTNYGTILSPTYEYYCITDFAAMNGVRFVTGTNQGHSGFTTNDWLPSVNTGSCFTNAESAATALKSQYPAAILVFIVRLSTNDSATAGSNNNPAGQASPATVAANDVTIGGRLLADFPGSKIFLDHPTFYSPNAHNGYTYEQAGLAGLITYFPAIDGAAATLNTSYPGRAYIGETTAFVDFAANYQAFQVAESGSNGTFFLHPNGTGGTAELGRLEAGRLYSALLAPSATPKLIRRIN